MKKLVLLIVSACLALAAQAQKAPKWMDKSKKAVLRVTTFDKDNRRINSTGGFFVSETGEALSAYSLFRGAARASVTDTDGNTYPVSYIIGADDLYDVIRFKVSIPGKKVPFLPLATGPVPVDAPVFLLLGTDTKEVAFKQGTVTEVSKLKDPYSYYKLSIPLESGQANAPLLLANGEVFALAQEDASGRKEHSYGVSASYVSALKQTATDIFNTVYTRIGIRKAWPEEAGQASVSLFLQAGSQDAKTYLETLNDFIATFPQAADGYMSRASHYAAKRSELAEDAAGRQTFLNLAMADMQTAARLSPNKGEVYYNQAKMIFAVATGDSSLTDSNWQVGAALAALQKAIGEGAQPAYHELEGHIYFSLEEYAAAYEAYMRVNENPSAASADSYYLAAKSLENIPGAQISDLIALLDSALARMGLPLPREAAPYVLERVEYKNQLALYPEAVEDYNLYYALVGGEVNDSFYFYREQAKFRAGDNEGALLDIREAIARNPQVADYHAEEAAVLVRMQHYEEALAGVQKALDLAPDFAACYRIRGVCFIRNGKKAEACEAFGKARELGDPIVARLIREHCP
ncbi:MAG: trypsin-like peptidase domain-containing protein [Tannerellaceae bacterium]|jgi:tetratricopeptide (TPR) repeat protein|nr:trypsin-like peptidase domain-containing protein [Tannerellaceae bacterium]